MKVKVYEAPTMQEAIAKVKRDLGSEAIILFTKKYQIGGFMGLFRKQRVEVTAGLDINTIGVANSRQQIKNARNKALLTSPGAHSTNALAASIIKTENESLNSLRKEVQEIKDAIKALVEPDEQSFDVLSQDPLLGRVEQILIDKEVDSEVIKNFMASMAVSLPQQKTQDMETARHLLSEKIKKEILTSGPISLSPYGPKVVALVGPTGVGKTTTLAKIAANYSLLAGKKVAFITADTYRIAAVEQLRTFGNIVDIPVEVADKPMDLKRVIQRHRDKDLILIDTAGRSPKNQKQVGELNKLLSSVEDIEIHLTLSATTGKQDMLTIIEKFKALNFHHLLFTKLDETSGIGALLSVATQVDYPISYFTTGQNVPDDIEVAKSDRLSTMMLN